MKLEIKIIGLNNHQPIVLNLQPYQKETTQTNNNGNYCYSFKGEFNNKLYSLFFKLNTLTKGLSIDLYEDGKYINQLLLNGEEVYKKLLYFVRRNGLGF